MRTISIATLLGSIVISSACATSQTPIESGVVPEETKTAAVVEEPELYKTLPDTVESFDLQGFKHFDDGSGGYSVRYANQQKRRIADVYIYPVAQENANLEHTQLVLGSTRATLMAIGEATRQGHYANFNVINAATRAHGARTVARVQATYLRQNLASYTLVYQTEHKGTLLKIRVTMPDNEVNRLNSEWDTFAETVFKQLIEGLGDENTSSEKTASL